MSVSKVPIDRLKLRYDNNCTEGVCKLPTKGYTCAQQKKRWFKMNKSIGEYLLWFVIIALFTFFVLYFWLPSYFQKAGGEPDLIKIFIASILVALVVVILLAWLKFV